MKIIKDITENEMIAIFLKGELNSERFDKPILNALKSYKIDRDIVDNYDLKNEEENKLRKKILADARGYNNKLLFDGFPKDVKWVRAELTREDIKNIKYIRYSYWLEISKGSRRVEDVIKTIQSGEEIFSESNDRFLEVAEKIKKGAKFPELILVSKGDNEDLVVLEGHLRLTAYGLAPEFISETIEVIVGFSKDLDKWGLY